MRSPALSVLFLTLFALFFSVLCPLSLSGVFADYKKVLFMPHRLHLQSQKTVLSLKSAYTMFGLGVYIVKPRRLHLSHQQ